MKHLLRIQDLSTEEILSILDRAEALRSGKAKPRRLTGAILGLLFFQPSTRTRFGFHAAIARLGGTAITLEQTKYEPGMSEPESLEDTVRSIANYCDAFVLRHPNNDSVDRVAPFLDVPLINGGNGTDEHPTQALIDLFAIRNWHGRLDNLRVGIVGDLARSRAAHSLILALHSFQPRELRLIYPRGAHPAPLLTARFTGPLSRLVGRIDFGELDVIYVAGLPPGSSPLYRSSTRSRFSLHPTSHVAPRCLVLCPLPRIDEIHPDLDSLPSAGFFTQSHHALFVRLAILDIVFRGHPHNSRRPSSPIRR